MIERFALVIKIIYILEGICDKVRREVVARIMNV